MRYHFWYVLIHIGLGLIGWQIFTFTNIGGLYAFGAAGVVQAYAIFEIHRDARPKFNAMQAQTDSMLERQQNEQDYRKRLTRTWFFRSCIYALLTLIAAMATQGATVQ